MARLRSALAAASVTGLLGSLACALLASKPCAAALQQLPIMGLTIL